MRRWIKWIILILVRPVIVMWLMIEGAPAIVTAIGKAMATVVRAWQGR